MTGSNSEVGARIQRWWASGYTARQLCDCTAIYAQGTIGCRLDRRCLGGEVIIKDMAATVDMQNTGDPESARKLAMIEHVLSGRPGEHQPSAIRLLLLKLLPAGS